MYFRHIYLYKHHIRHGSFSSWAPSLLSGLCPDHDCDFKMREKQHGVRVNIWTLTCIYAKTFAIYCTVLVFNLARVFSRNLSSTNLHTLVVPTILKNFLGLHFSRTDRNGGFFFFIIYGYLMLASFFPLCVLELWMWDFIYLFIYFCIMVWMNWFSQQWYVQDFKNIKSIRRNILF